MTTCKYLFFFLPQISFKRIIHNKLVGIFHLHRCDCCGRQFLLNSQFAAHKSKLRAIDEQRYVCSVCSKTFQSKYHLTNHELIHKKKTGKQRTERLFPCSSCNRKLVVWIILKITNNLSVWCFFSTRLDFLRKHCENCMWIGFMANVLTNSKVKFANIVRNHFERKPMLWDTSGEYMEKVKNLSVTFVMLGSLIVIH